MRTVGGASGLARRYTTYAVAGALLVGTVATASTAMAIGIAGPLSFTPTDFGSVKVGSTNPLTVTVTNHGGNPALISRLAVDGVSFATGDAGTCALGANIAGSGTCTVKLEWTPAAVGPLEAELRMGYSEGAGSTNYAVGLTGTAVSDEVPVPNVSNKPNKPRDERVVGGPKAASYMIKWKTLRVRRKSVRWARTD